MNKDKDTYLVSLLNFLIISLVLNLKLFKVNQM